MGGEQPLLERAKDGSIYLIPLGLLRATGAECGVAGIAASNVRGVGLEGWTGDAGWAVDELGSCRLVAVLRGTAHGTSVRHGGGGMLLLRWLIR